MAQEREAQSGVARFIPGLYWINHYDRSWLRGDMIAGLAVAALVVPKALGYAGIAGVPIQHGLYATAAGAILYALFGTSRQISTGPSSALAAVAGSAVVLASVTDDDAVKLVSAIAIVTGLLFLLLAIFKLGWISNFLSKAVVTGFLFGAAIDVVVGELPKLTGTEAEGETVWREFADWIRNIGSIDGTTFLVGVVSLAGILGIRFSKTKVPGALVLVVGGLLGSYLFDLGDRGVALVGDVPRGFVAPTFPGVQYIIDNIDIIGPAALGLVMIGFSQTVGDARVFASRHRYRVRIDQELVAQGVSNVGSGILQGIPVSTSLSASSLNDESGARTPLASFTTGVVVILTLIVLAPLFSDLPKAVLGALIIDAVVFGMMDIPELQRLYSVARFDFWIAVMAILAVLSAGVLAGVIIGVVISLVWLIYITTNPHLRVLGRLPGTAAFRGVEDYPESETYPGLLVVRFDAGLFFASAHALDDSLRELIDNATSPYHTLIISFEGTNFVDSQGSEALAEVLELCDSNGIELRLARVKHTILDVLRRDGVVDKIGEDRIYGNIYEAAADRMDAPTAPPSYQE